MARAPPAARPGITGAAPRTTGESETMTTYSHSRIETFRQCPRKYYYAYIAKVRLEDVPEQIATFMGSRVHDCLEYLYGRVAKAQVPTVDALRGRFDSDWSEHWTSDIVIHDREMTGADYQRLGWRCIEQYYQRFHPFDQGVVVGLERRIRLPLDRAQRYQMVGYIDRLAKASDGAWQIHDYKTNSRLPTQEEKDADPQLGYYEIGVRRMWKGVKRVQLVWHFLQFDQTIMSERTPDQLKSLRAAAIATIKDIEARDQEETGFPTNEGPLCSYCSYQHVCPARKHLYQIRVMPESKWAKEPAVKLVDRWARLEAQRQELRDQQEDLDAQIDEVRQALIDVAKRQGLEVVVGREKEVVVRQTTRVMFPRKSEEPEQAAKLEAALRVTRWWKELSTVNAARLRVAWEDDDQSDPQLRRLLKRFVWTEEEATARMRDRRDP